MALKRLTNFGQSSQLNGALLHNALVQQAAYVTDVLSGLVAGAGTFSTVYDVTDRDGFTFQVKNITGGSLTIQWSLDSNENTATWTSSPTAAVTADGFVTVSGNFRLMRINYTAAPTSGSPYVDFAAVRS